MTNLWLCELDFQNKKIWTLWFFSVEIQTGVCRKTDFLLSFADENIRPSQLDFLLLELRSSSADERFPFPFRFEIFDPLNPRTLWSAEDDLNFWDVFLDQSWSRSLIPEVLIWLETWDHFFRKTVKVKTLENLIFVWELSGSAPPTSRLWLTAAPHEEPFTWLAGSNKIPNPPLRKTELHNAWRRTCRQEERRSGGEEVRVSPLTPPSCLSGAEGGVSLQVLTGQDGLVSVLGPVVGNVQLLGVGEVHRNFLKGKKGRGYGAGRSEPPPTINPLINPLTPNVFTHLHN